jgi:hypothetical protein
MSAMNTRIRSVCVIALTLLTLGAPLRAQEVAETRAKNVFSANPFGLLFEFFNAEYERAVGESSTVGVGGSTISDDFDGTEDRYLNADVFYRFYPNGALNGWAFGVKVGLTTINDPGNAGTYVGYGFDVNRSWLLGKGNNFYVGVGFGLKRLVGLEDPDGIGLNMIPTFRIVNIGVAF